MNALTWTTTFDSPHPLEQVLSPSICTYWGETFVYPDWLEDIKNGITISDFEAKYRDKIVSYYWSNMVGWALYWFWVYFYSNSCSKDRVLKEVLTIEDEYKKFRSIEEFVEYTRDRQWESFLVIDYNIKSIPWDHRNEIICLADFHRSTNMRSLSSFGSTNASPPNTTHRPTIIILESTRRAWEVLEATHDTIAHLWNSTQAKSVDSWNRWSEWVSIKMENNPNKPIRTYWNVENFLQSLQGKSINRMVKLLERALEGNDFSEDARAILRERLESFTTHNWWIQDKAQYNPQEFIDWLTWSLNQQIAQIERQLKKSKNYGEQYKVALERHRDTLMARLSK